MIGTGSIAIVLLEAENKPADNAIESPVYYFHRIIKELIDFCKPKLENDFSNPSQQAFKQLEDESKALSPLIIANEETKSSPKIDDELAEHFKDTSNEIINLQEDVKRLRETIALKERELATEMNNIRENMEAEKDNEERAIVKRMEVKSNDLIAFNHLKTEAEANLRRRVQEKSSKWCQCCCPFNPDADRICIEYRQQIADVNQKILELIRGIQGSELTKDLEETINKLNNNQTELVELDLNALAQKMLDRSSDIRVEADITELERRTNLLNQKSRPIIQDLINTTNEKEELIRSHMTELNHLSAKKDIETAQQLGIVNNRLVSYLLRIILAVESFTTKLHERFIALSGDNPSFIESNARFNKRLADCEAMDKLALKTLTELRKVADDIHCPEAEDRSVLNLLTIFNDVKARDAAAADKILTISPAELSIALLIESISAPPEIIFDLESSTTPSIRNA